MVFRHRFEFMKALKSTSISISRDRAFLTIQGAMRFICTSMSSTLFSADHSLRALSMRDAFMDKMDRDVSHGKGIQA